MSEQTTAVGRARLDPFKNFTLTWWQGAIYKIGMLTFALAIGSHWPDFFGAYTLPLCVIAVPTLGYVTYVWWKQ